MNQAPVISRVLIVPGLPASTDGSLQNVNFQSISVGLIIDDARPVWGECVVDSRHQEAGVYSSYDADLAITALRQRVVPLLEGRSLDDFQALMASVDAFRETAVITRQPSEEQSGVISRRGFLTGKLQSDLSREQITVTRPFHPAIRYGVSQALLSALAWVRGQTLTEVIAAEYNLPLSLSPPSLHLDIGADELTPDASILSNPIQSLGYSLSGHNPRKQFGPNGERLQRFVRQLTNLLDSVTEPSYCPALHLDVSGGLGQLFDNDAGRILGVLYGLEQVAKPYQLRVTDPVLLADPQMQRALMRQLMDYTRMRRLNLELAASKSINTLADVEAYVEAGAAHMLELSFSRLGSVHQVIQAIRTCHHRKVAVLLRDNFATAVATPPLACHVALAAQPALIAATWKSRERQDLTVLYDEMARTLAWLTR